MFTDNLPTPALVLLIIASGALIVFLYFICKGVFLYTRQKVSFISRIYKHFNSPDYYYKSFYSKHYTLVASPNHKLVAYSLKG